jgi:hypothetical protein
MTDEKILAETVLALILGRDTSKNACALLRADFKYTKIRV